MINDKEKENICEKNCPDFKGMEILHKEQCDCSCHSIPEIERKEILQILERRIKQADNSGFGEIYKNTQKNLLWSIWDEIEPRPTGQA